MKCPCIDCQCRRDQKEMDEDATPYQVKVLDDFQNCNVKYVSSFDCGGLEIYTAECGDVFVQIPGCVDFVRLTRNDNQIKVRSSSSKILVSELCINLK